MGIKGIKGIRGIRGIMEGDQRAQGDQVGPSSALILFVHKRVAVLRCRSVRRHAIAMCLFHLPVGLRLPAWLKPEEGICAPSLILHYRINPNF